MADPYELSRQAASELREMTGIGAYDLAIVLGSGWREGASALGVPSSEIVASSLSGFVAPTVAGHNGQLLSVCVGDKNVLLIAGRVHLYEGNSADQVVHPVRTAIAAGANNYVVKPFTEEILRQKLQSMGLKPK